jgi:hypothetical protein
MGPMVVKISEGPLFGSISGLVTVALVGGQAVGPLVGGQAVGPLVGGGRDRDAFAGSILLASTGGIWNAASRTVRLVPGRTRH